MTNNQKNTDQKVTYREQATNSDKLSYQKVKTLFIQEANSLIPDKMIEQTLSDEKKILDNAETLHISTKKLVSSNTLRHCKDLLRKNQPFYAFYIVLNFLTELSIILFLLGLLFCIIQYIAGAGNTNSFSNSFEFLYPLIIITGLLLNKALYTHYLRNTLLNATLPSKSTDEIARMKNKILMHRIALMLSIIVICGILLGFTVYLGLSRLCHTTLFELFMGYVVCIFLAGIHNTLYSSHLIPFFSIGGFLLTKRPTKDIEHVTNQYMELSFLQLLSNKGKTLEDFKHDSNLSIKIKATLRSRLVTQRVYYALAILILILLAGICLYQISLSFTVTLLGFLSFTLIATACLITATLSANHVIKKLPKTTL